MPSGPLVLYHANCADGFCAAWVAHRVLGDAAEYVPVQYGQDPPDVSGRDVFILDFSYKRPVLEEMSRQAARLIVLDHHKTAREELADVRLACPGFVRFDMDRSGGRLAWEHFCAGEKSPWLVNYTEDRDLWRWDLLHSREVSAALASRPRTFLEWDRLHERSPARSAPDGLVTEGAAVLRYQEQLVESLCATAREVELDGHKVLAANTACLISEVAGKLAEGRPFGAAWFVRGDGKTQWSLRSRDGGVDVFPVARKLGGGGHRNAAGFEV
jgi:uncharacterized protein